MSGHSVTPLQVAGGCYLLCRNGSTVLAMAGDQWVLLQLPQPQARPVCFALLHQFRRHLLLQAHRRRCPILHITPLRPPPHNAPLLLLAGRGWLFRVYSEEWQLFRQSREELTLVETYATRPAAAACSERLKLP